MSDLEMDMDLMDELAEMSAIPCDVSAALVCPNEAEWSAITSCCAYALLICQTHYESLMALIEKKAMVQCERCPSMGTFNVMITSIERL